MTTYYILPNQLHEISKYVSPIVTDQENDIKKIFVWEHPSFFIKYKFNKKKLILHRASMKKYTSELKKHVPPSLDVIYIDFGIEHLVNYKNKVMLYEPINKISDFMTPKANKNLHLIPSPNFMLAKEEYSELRNKRKSIRFTTSFYPICKKKINFLNNVGSQDKHNRKRLPKKPKFHGLPRFEDKGKYLKEAKKYVETHFSANYGVSTDKFIFPIDRHQALNWLDHFLNKNLHNFGPYQDAIAQNDSFLHHSVLSSSLNIGLLNPCDLIARLKEVTITDTNLSSVEGFVRQLCWREFQRFCYYEYPELEKLNYFGFTNKLGMDWYNATTGLQVVDDTITKAFETGYLHHIERLMIMGNFMTLSEINPVEGHKWFMEFAIDSFEWVMHQNVFDMVFFNSNGKTTHKPYITSSNYLKRMSNYKVCDNQHSWNNQWDDMYENFKKKYRKQLWRYRYHFGGLKKKNE